MGRNDNKKGNNSRSDKTYFSDDMTKEVVGRLFEQYASEDGRNYFAPSEKRRTTETRKAKKAEDRKKFFDDTDIDTDIEFDDEIGMDSDFSSDEDVQESKISRFIKKAKQAVLQNDDDDSDEDAEDDNINEAVTSMDADSEIDLQQQTYVPRRKVKPKKNRTALVSEPSAVEIDNTEDSEIELDNDEPVVVPQVQKKNSKRAQMEKRVEEMRKQQENQHTKIKPFDDEEDKVPGQAFLDDVDNEEDDDTEIIEIPIARVALIAITVIVVVLIAVLSVKCVNYSSQIKSATAKIEELEKKATSSTYEKEIEELKSKNEELTKQLETMQSAATVVAEGQGESETPKTINGESPTVGADGSGENNENLNQEVNTSQSYTIKKYAGETPWELAEEAYGDGSRYDEILKFNKMTAEEFENITKGTELKIPN